MKKSYYLDEQGSFVIENYNSAKLFSDFFPGVSGLYGIPMWAFFVNRGQGVSSFGIESKDRAILAFQPADKAYRQTSIQGFRTFLKIKNGGLLEKFYEPFSNPVSSPYKIQQRMLITSHDLTIEEVNTTLGLKVTVNYFTLPKEPFAGLVRRVTFENLTRKKLDIQWVDGLPAINPYGLKDWLGKHISRTVEAWVTVDNINQNAPFYRLKVEVADTPQVTPIKEGNFYFAFDAHSAKLFDMIVEASCVFGASSDFLVPEKFLQQKNFKAPVSQETTNRTPSAMSYGRFSVAPGKKEGLVALAGFAHDLAQLKQVVQKCTGTGFIDKKADLNRSIIDEIKGYCLTHSSSEEFNQYCQQTFLDNILRGGLPISLPTAEGMTSFNVYSRKHGDLERDYNFFTLSPTFLSQGNGNYRDVNQNRRNDVWFNKDVQDSGIVNFMNLIQADGYNPLVIKGTVFVVRDEKAIDEILKEFGIKTKADVVREMLKKGFMPGDLLQLVSCDKTLKENPEDFLLRVLGVCAKQESAEPGEGFWTDHWTYNLDLIQSYLKVYPENLQNLLLEKKIFNFFLNDFYVLPRDSRLVLTPAGVRQYHSLSEHDKTVQARSKGYKLRVHNGQGDIYTTNLLVKLICLLANKVATLDPSGIGVEMEANKPNWYDALNGLPGLLGSSISETFEVKRLAIFLREALEKMRLPQEASVMVFEELSDFIFELDQALSGGLQPLVYWQLANDIKEKYRHAIRYGIKGQEKPLTMENIKEFLENIIEKCESGICLAQYDNGLFATYFYHEVTEYDVLGKSHHGPDHVRPKAFKRHDLPLFLEGFVHALRVQKEKDAAKKLFKAVRSSSLYDKKLGMYRVNADLSKESDEIGRTRIFPAGWLENGSVWLHMEYKYFLELLRGGLTKEFFDEIHAAMIPFLEPARYGRSILQNSSFIASSAHVDQNLHGQGFVARLSGSTAEFLHMWLMMNMGHEPFRLDARGFLSLTFEPILPSWLFTRKANKDCAAHTYSFKLFAKTRVIYHNPKLGDTFGLKAVKPQKVVLTYPSSKVVEIEGGILGEAQAKEVREGLIERVDVYLN
ncbi:MAG: hypothetical protein HQL13_01240 [Candidatus Omnitrophica bacterium]|nr:hypothetical protein [Candidatus Omnitrophota bacterium]